MADEAFALSPISARAALPSEEDYDAISQAFMETSRGRWFLGEYAKRNRNADTRMVLDAVARIEETIAAQRQPAAESGLSEALAAIRRAIDEAQATAAVAVENLALEENLAPIRKGARVIREISWRWREIGADARICDLIDSQVGAIEGACGQISSADALGALSATFDLIKARIAGFGDGNMAAAQAAAAAVPSPSSAASDQMSAAAVQTMQAVSTTDDTDAAMSMPAQAVVETAETVVVTAEAVDATAEAADVTAEAAGVTAEITEVTAEAADAHDEAVLDLIALEMAAPDPADIDDACDTDTQEIHLAESPPAEPIMLLPADPIVVTQKPEPAAAPAATQPSLQPTHEPSLGSSLIANGIVRRLHVSESDPLAPIRRMSQAEKIAFFS